MLLLALRHVAVFLCAYEISLQRYDCDTAAATIGGESLSVRRKEDCSGIFGILLRVQPARNASGPIRSVFDPFSQHADLIFCQADLGARHHFGMRTAALHGADEQAAVGIAWVDVVAPAGAAFEGRGFRGEIERRRRQAAVVALQAVLLQHRLHLSEKIVPALAGWHQRAGRDDEKDGNETQDHATSLTTALKSGYAVLAQSYAEA